MPPKATILDSLSYGSNEEDFWSLVEVHGDPAVCWLWRGATKNGYGAFQPPGGVWFLAHRVAWALYWNAEPESSLVLRHLCDVKACVNPQHLRLGTARQNREDAWKDVAVSWCPDCSARYEEGVYSRHDPRQGVLFPI